MKKKKPNRRPSMVKQASPTPKLSKEPTRRGKMHGVRIVRVYTAGGGGGNEQGADDGESAFGFDDSGSDSEEAVSKPAVIVNDQPAPTAADPATTELEVPGKKEPKRQTNNATIFVTDDSGALATKSIAAGFCGSPMVFANTSIYDDNSSSGLLAAQFERAMASLVAFTTSQQNTKTGTISKSAIEGEVIKGAEWIQLLEEVGITEATVTTVLEDMYLSSYEFAEFKTKLIDKQVTDGGYQPHSRRKQLEARPVVPEDAVLETAKKRFEAKRPKVFADTSFKIVAVNTVNQILKRTQTNETSPLTSSQAAEAVTWLIDSFDVQPYVKGAEDGTHPPWKQLLSIREFTRELEELGQFKRLQDGANEYQRILGDERLKPLFDNFDLHAQFSPDKMETIVAFHKVYARERKKFEQLPKAIQEKNVNYLKARQTWAMPKLFQLMEKKLNWKDPVAFAERTALLAMLMFSKLLESGFTTIMQGLAARVQIAAEAKIPKNGKDGDNGDGDDAAKVGLCSFESAPVKGYARGYNKIYSDYLNAESPGGRAAWIMDPLRCLLAGQDVTTVKTILEYVSEEMEGVGEYATNHRDHPAMCGNIVLRYLLYSRHLC